MKASRLLAMVRPRYIRCRCNLGGEVPIHDFESVRPRSGARNNALDEIHDEMLRDACPTLIEQTAFDSLHGCLYLKKIARPFNEDDIFALEQALNPNRLVGFKELLGFTFLLQALA